MKRKRYQAFHTHPEPKPGLQGVLRQLFIGTDIYWGEKLDESIGPWESAGHVWRGYVSHPLRRKVRQMNLENLIRKWDDIPAYRKRSLIRGGVITLTTLATTTYETRKYGFKTAIRPRLIWNLPRERQKVYYLQLLVQIIARDVQNSRNEKELKENHSTAVQDALKLVEEIRQSVRARAEAAKS